LKISKIFQKNPPKTLTSANKNIACVESLGSFLLITLWSFMLERRLDDVCFFPTPLPSIVVPLNVDWISNDEGILFDEGIPLWPLKEIVDPLIELASDGSVEALKAKVVETEDKAFWSKTGLRSGIDFWPVLKKIKNLF